MENFCCLITHLVDEKVANESDLDRVQALQGEKAVDGLVLAISPRICLFDAALTLSQREVGEQA